MNVSVLFILQAGKKFGMGHLTRCLRIARFYSNPYIYVITDLKDYANIQALLSGFEHSVQNEKSSITQLLSEHNFELLVTDCAEAPEHIIHSANSIGVPMISLDNEDLGARSEIYIAPLPSEEPKHANFMGLSYAPIDPRYFLNPEEAHTIKEILITLGGSDPKNNAVKIVNALKDTDYKITVISGPFSHYKLEDSANVRIVHDVSNLFPYIQKSDLIFCGPGSTMIESLAAKKRVIAVAHNHNQYLDIAGMHGIQSLYMFLTAKNVKKAIANSKPGNLSLPEGFDFKDWLLDLSDIIVKRPASCPLCGSFSKLSYFRTGKQDQFVCENCKSTYVYNLFKEDAQNPDEIIADNSEQEQTSYKDSVLKMREDSNRRIQILKRLLPPQSYHTPYTLMDIGAEHGIFVQEAKHNGFTAQGVELSLFARRIALDNHNINIIDSMDKVYEQVNEVVTLWKKLEFLEHPVEYLVKIAHLVPAGGILAFRIPIAVRSAITKGFFRATEKGGRLLAERVGFTVAHIANYTNNHNEKFLEFYCIKKSGLQ